MSELAFIVQQTTPKTSGLKPQTYVLQFCDLSECLAGGEWVI